VALGEGPRPLESVAEAALDALLALPFDERLEIPGARLEVGVDRLGRGCGGHRPAA
jgi:hypothetical protein